MIKEILTLVGLFVFCCLMMWYIYRRVKSEFSLDYHGEVGPACVGTDGQERVGHRTKWLSGSSYQCYTCGVVSSAKRVKQ